MRYLAASLISLLAVVPGLAAPAAPTFQSAVQPVLAKTCSPCHNDRVSSGGLNLSPFSSAGSMAENRDGWEKILQKIRTGEMPPKGVPRPAAQMDALTKFIQAEFERAARNLK